MTKLAISVLVPCYNGAKYINRCFDSILGQNYDQELIKIIVINDGSTDNSLEILKQYQALHPTRIKIIDQENKGLAVTRNLLVDSVDTEFFIFSDVDDYYLPNAFMHIVNASQNGKSDIVTSRTYRIGINGKKKIW
jgi:glycosyltransferase involved in cell wall biosynthesis